MAVFFLPGLIVGVTIVSGPAVLLGLILLVISSVVGTLVGSVVAGTIGFGLLVLTCVIGAIGTFVGILSCLTLFGISFFAACCTVIAAFVIGSLLGVTGATSFAIVVAVVSIATLKFRQKTIYRFFPDSVIAVENEAEEAELPPSPVPELSGEQSSEPQDESVEEQVDESKDFDPPLAHNDELNVMSALFTHSPMLPPIAEETNQDTTQEVPAEEPIKVESSNQASGSQHGTVMSKRERKRQRRRRKNEHTKMNNFQL